MGDAEGRQRAVLGDLANEALDQRLGRVPHVTKANTLTDIPNQTNHVQPVNETTHAPDSTRTISM